MPPNVVEPNISENVEEENKRINTREETIEMQPPSTPTPFINSVTMPRMQENVRVNVILSTTNMIANIFIGAIIGIVYVFCFSSGVPLGATRLHIVLCVTGYILLMAQGIMSFAPSNGLTSRLNLIHKRRAHLTLQLLGSILAITGTFIKIIDKSEHFNTTHGIFGLIALIFTTISLVNGCASFYAQELQRILPGNITKLLHVCFGTIAFTAANITLCFGFDKSLFRIWSTDPLAGLCISFTVITLIIVIVTPLTTFKKKVTALSRR